MSTHKADIILTKMLEDCMSNIVVRKLKEGRLVIGVDKSCIEVVDREGNKHYLCHVNYNYNIGGTTISLHGNERNSLAKQFITKYTYEDVVKKFIKLVEDKKARVEQAEKDKPKVEKLGDIVNSYLIKHCLMGTATILADNKRLEYYVELNLGYDNKVDIYLNNTNDSEFECRYNYESYYYDKINLLKLLDMMIYRFKKHNLQIEELKKKADLEKHKAISLNKFVSMVWSKQAKVIVKLKSGYQCIYGDTRFSVGTGKEGKFYNIGSKVRLEEYIRKRGITKYYIISDTEKTSSLTDDVLKKLPYSSIYA